MLKKVHNAPVFSSYKDPSGTIFSSGNRIIRQVHPSYKEEYEQLMTSGLSQKLVSLGYLIPHKEVNFPNANKINSYKYLEPVKIPFISYPYEWCFSQWKDAALLTLSIQKIALEYNMSLKDASAFNIQFLNGKPILIDTLSFEIHTEEPWVAYRQFVEHFLCPLSLMSYTDVRLGRLFQLYLDGIPTDLTKKLLPKKAMLNLNLFFHIYLHASAQKKYNKTKKEMQRKKFGRTALLGLIDSLYSAIEKLQWQADNIWWSDYYRNRISYNEEGLTSKKEIIEKCAELLHPISVWDIGGNTGYFSRIFSKKGIPTICFDIDPASVENNYQEVTKNNEKNILPLFLDLTNPTPALGWNNKERFSLVERRPVDTIMALALIHHIAIGNNVPFSYLASLFSDLCKNLIIEFVPKNDSLVVRLLSMREDIFIDYSKEKFEEEFEKFFDVIKVYPIKKSKRMIYIMKKMD